MATELAKAFVQIIPSANGIKGSITTALGGEAESAGISSGQGFGNKMLGTIKGIIAAAGIGKALASTISEGAALQQSLGGIETLFKDNADKLVQYANEAYRTAGLSANDYMQTVTSFSASLLQGLSGDTLKAAELSDMAITDMSDNANKMGTSMESIQFAYQGFAKQNYTMLDNLKLGYGGTKTEMQRLLADAQKISGVKYDISNLSDVYSAIHVIQGELDITGTTAKEAASTISGSLAAMKSSFKNVLGALTLGQDIQPALNGLVTTSSTFLFNNLLPAVGNIFKALPSAAFSFLQQATPQLLTNGGKIITDTVNGIYLAFPQLTQSAFGTISSFVGGIISNLPQLMQNGAGMITTLSGGIKNMLPVFIASAGEVVTTLISGLISNFPQIISSGFDLAISLITGIGKSAPHIIAAAGNVANQIFETIKNVNWFDLGKNIIRGMIDGIGAMAGALWEAATNIAKAALDAIKSFLGIHSPSTVMRDKVGKYIPIGLADGILKNANWVTQAMEELSFPLTKRLSSQLSYSFAGGIGSEPYKGTSMNFYQTINSHDSLSPSEISQETEDFLSRTRWKNP